MSQSHDIYSIKKNLIELIMESQGIFLDIDKIDGNDLITTNLNWSIDSLDVLDLIINIESKFDIELQDIEMKDITIDQFANRIYELVNSKEVNI